MHPLAYSQGCLAALVKLGMSLSFDTPQDRADHRSTGNTIMATGGVAGALVGGLAGAKRGTGALATGAGALIGAGIGALGAGTAYDAQYDIRKRTAQQYAATRARLDAAGGLSPTYTQSQ